MKVPDLAICPLAVHADLETLDAFRVTVFRRVPDVIRLGARRTRPRAVLRAKRSNEFN